MADESDADTEGAAPESASPESSTPAPGETVDIVGAITKLEGAIAALNDRVTVMDRDFKAGGPAPVESSEDDSEVTIDDLFE